MRQAKTYNCEGLVLRRSKTGEHDLMVSLFTKEQGKVRALAMGAARPNSTRGPLLEPLTLGRYQLRRGQDIDFVMEALGIDTMPEVKENPTTLARAMTMTEIVEALNEEYEESPEVLELAANCIRALPDARDPDGPVRYFQFHALRLNGTEPEIYLCCECGDDIQPNRHRMSIPLGGSICHECDPPEANLRPLSLRAMKVLRMLHREDLDKACDILLHPRVGREIQTLMRDMITYHAARDIRPQTYLDNIERGAGRR